MHCHLSRLVQLVQQIFRSYLSVDRNEEKQKGAYSDAHQIEHTNEHEAVNRYERDLPDHGQAKGDLAS